MAKSSRTPRNNGSAVRQSVARFQRNWKRASPGQRMMIGAGLVILAAVILTIIIGLVRAVQWRDELRDARERQQQLTAQYDFNPGNIISDRQFFNADAMNERQIQAFLDEQGARCNGERCLKSMRFDTHPQPKSEYCQAWDVAGQQSAAAIIAGSARSCGISPKVLLTMLQKEQHLVSATDPGDFQFKSAMGLSCPDNADCDPKYAGFFNQVYGSAERYQYYLHHEEQYGYREHELKFVQYNPNTACGGTKVYIENKATALLYIYTPYQPNDAALAAGAGEGNSCSSYGNRNFSIIYSSWFGDPRL